MDGERGVTETDGNSDAGLVAAIRERQDVSAFAGLVHRHQDVAVQVAFSVLDDAALAEDAAQKAFLYAYTHLGALREPAALPPGLVSPRRPDPGIAADAVQGLVCGHCRYTDHPREPRVDRSGP